MHSLTFLLPILSWDLPEALMEGGLQRSGRNHVWSLGEEGDVGGVAVAAAVVFAILLLLRPRSPLLLATGDLGPKLLSPWSPHRLPAQHRFRRCHRRRRRRRCCCPFLSRPTECPLKRIVLVVASSLCWTLLITDATSSGFCCLVFEHLSIKLEALSAVCRRPAFLWA